MKFCESCGTEIDTRDGDNKCNSCEFNEALSKDARKTLKTKARIQRRERHDALKSLGLTRVRGACGGVYYE